VNVSPNTSYPQNFRIEEQGYRKWWASSQFPDFIPALFILKSPEFPSLRGCRTGGREDGESETVFIERVVEEAVATGFVEGVVGGSYESGVADVCFSDYGQVE